MSMSETEMKYLKLARRAREENNAEDAKKYSDLVRNENPDNVEARFFFPLYRIWDSQKKDWGNCFIDFCNVVNPCIKAVCESDMSDDEKKKLLEDMFNESKDLPYQCNRVLNEINANNSRTSEIRTCGRTGMKMLYGFGDTIEKYCANKPEIMSIAVEAWKAGVYRQQQWYGMGMDKTLPEKYTAKIQKIDPSYVLPKKGGCIQFA